VRLSIHRLAPTFLWMAALFAGAGRLDWTRGWFAFAVFIVGMAAVGIVLKRVAKEVMEARDQHHFKQARTFDKFFLTALISLSFVQPAVAGADVVRFGWSSWPWWTFGAGAALMLASMALVGWTLAINRFAETTVRIQTERGHTVIESGPYRFVRHPMYAASVLMYPGISVMLGSAWSIPVALVVSALFVWRTGKEDRILRRELPGYEEFAARTRYRLLPGLW
jgi:protein-S-isoprenylcysteine O-methyltransferase Ste14